MITFFVTPVCRYTVFGKLMHLGRTYLYLDRLTFRAMNRGMQGLVTILFRVGDIVIKLFFDVSPLTVDQPQGSITIGDRFDGYAYSPDIVLSG